ncbi:hypothetical protein ORJ66_09735 [Pseudoalteromonas tunicata]|uniref:hypothetical protein n=1 Tax=Pseudoalteromonas tunicata TaxID=314281 RepID=UPI00273CFEA0|nr:hypothetical protein [Pseudoalteromonas tunicata]MDP5213321.1 hypothetical protein [Pseudoalteromonas tunicata]
MKIKGLKRVTIVSSVVLFSASTFSVFTSTSGQNLGCACPSSYDNVYAYNRAIAQCRLNTDSNKSWFAWLKGDSRSAQFHYLDLLELLSESEQDSSMSKTQYIPVK